MRAGDKRYEVRRSQNDVPMKVDSTLAVEVLGNGTLVFFHQNDDGVDEVYCAIAPGHWYSVIRVA